METYLRKRKRTWVDRAPLLTGTVLLVFMIGCGVSRSGRTGSLPTDAGPRSSQSPAPLVQNLRRAVERELLQHLEKDQAAVLDRLTEAKSIPANFKQGLVLETFRDPWSGLGALELQGLRLAGQKHLIGMIGVLEESMGRLEKPVESFPAPQDASLKEHIGFVVSVLEQAQDLRALALEHLSLQDRRFLFEYSARLVEDFYIHFPERDEPDLQRTQDELRFSRLINHQLRYSSLIASAQVLAQLADTRWLQRVGGIIPDPGVSSRSHPAVEGAVLRVEETSVGQIIIGGPGPNLYTLDKGVALVIDVGGDDTYRGKIAASVDIMEGNRVIIDLAGNDAYHASPLGLATGRLGVGLLIDSQGDDHYYLSPGTGGAGFAGLGILIDLSGNDEYQGDKLTQGAAIGGLGLLVDGAGNDNHSSFGYAQGFGGPLGIGTIMDVGGDDFYQCGNHYPSSYNETDLPGGDPDDSSFQYDAFCMGFGTGTLYRDPQLKSSSLAGGRGMMIDVDGDDRYRSANFSQGSAYFFGAGIKLDLGGDDQHAGARYGLGTAAHFGVGLFIDFRGSDHYTSSGPIYNGGSAWDRSVTMFVDGGQQADFYDFFGLGRADHGSWSLSIEVGGLDRYSSTSGLGRASDRSMVGFFDLSGEDEYGAGSSDLGNAVIRHSGEGGLFVDR